MIKESTEELDWSPLETMIINVKEAAPLLIGLILGAEPTSASYARISIRLHFSNIKVVAVLLIICRSAYCNNSNYLPLFIALYLYSTKARVDAITLLNHLSISIL